MVGLSLKKHFFPRYLKIYHTLLNQLTKKGLWQDIAGLVTDEMLESIAVTGTPSEVSTQIFDRYGNIAARIAPSIFSGDPAVTAELIKALKN